MKGLIIAGIVLVSLTSFAEKKHRHHEAHSHGAGQLNIAFDNLVGKIEFKAAAEGIVGFEHQAKSDKDKKAVTDAISKFENQISHMVAFEAKAQCSFLKEKVEVVSEKDSHHSDFAASYQVTCKQSLLGSQLTIDFTSFKKIKDLDVVIMVNDLQKSVEVKSKPVTIELKN